MNDISKIQSAVDEGKQETNIADAAKQSPPKKRKFGVILLVIFLFFALLVAVMTGGIYVVRNHAAMNAVQQKQIIELQREVYALQNAGKKQQELLKDTQGKIQRWASSAEASVSLLQRVYDLVKFANDLLVMGNNNDEALRLLNIANNLITNDVKFTALKLALAKDIASLQQIPKIDRGSLLTNLEKLKAKIALLRPPSVDDSSVAQVFSIETTNYPLWKRILLAAQRSLQNAIKIDKQQTAPFLPPKQLATLLLNLQAEITQAEWAVMNKQDELYKASLCSSINWLNSYFPQSYPAVKEVLQELRGLGGISIPANFNVYDLLLLIQGNLLQGVH